MRTITTMEFRKSPGEFFYEVRKRRQSFLITYMGKPCAKLVPIDDSIIIQSDGTILGEKPVTMGADGARLLGTMSAADEIYECKEHDNPSCPHGVCEECKPPSCASCGVNNVDDLVYDGQGNRIGTIDDSTEEIVYPLFVPEGATFAEVWASFDIDAVHMRVIRNNAPPEVFKKVEPTFPVEAGTFIELSLEPLRPGRAYRITWLRE